MTHPITPKMRGTIVEENSRIDVLRTLIPFHRLPEEQLQTLEEKGKFLRVAENATLFSRDSREEFSYWVVSESIDLVAKDHSVVKVKAGTQRAKLALDDTTPHLRSAVAVKDAVVFKMSKPVADLMVRWPNLTTTWSAMCRILTRR